VLYETLLDMREIEGSHSGENMASSVFATLESMGLEEKVRSDGDKNWRYLLICG
jgi:hypothetical protein